MDILTPFVHTCPLSERHKLITHPRSDCLYLPKGHYVELQIVAQSITKTAATLSVRVRKADLDLKSKA
jgi:DNA topoisomerase-3